MVKAHQPATLKATVEKEKALLTLELNEVREISELLFKRLEKKAQAIEALEAAVDRKTEALEKKTRAFETIGATMDRKLQLLEKKATAFEALEAAVEQKTEAFAKRAQAFEGLEALVEASEKKSRDFKALESEVSMKIEALEGLMKRVSPAVAGDGPVPAQEGGGRHHEIVALRGKGLRSEDIAQALGMPRGEVDLILALNAQRA